MFTMAGFESTPTRGMFITGLAFDNRDEGCNLFVQVSHVFIHEYRPLVIASSKGLQSHE
jgi:hypothetical protein